jgi:hypothetical protein
MIEGESLSVVSFWGDRPEPVEDLAARLSRFLRELGELHPLLSTWVERGGSRATASTAVGIDPETLTQRLSNGRNRKDVGGEVIEELGFRFGFWNGKDASVGIGGTVGLYAGNPAVRNAVNLKLGTLDSGTADLSQIGRARAITRAFVDAWEPDSVSWMSRSMFEVHPVEAGVPPVGWLTYLSAPRLKRAKKSIVPSEPMGSGSLFVLGDDIRTLQIPSVVEARQDLARLGMLRPSL